MTTPTIPFNFAPTDPSLKDLLDLLRKDIFLNLNCCHVGKIQSFNSEKQTATVSINYKKTVFQLNRESGLYNPVLYDYPPLIDCPVVVLGGGNAHLTFPIASGDDCLVIFNDRAIDTWFQGSSNSPVPVARFHSFADGFVLVGVNSQPDFIEDYDGTRAVLRNGEAGVGVGESLVKIFNEATTLGQILTQLNTALTTLTTAISGATPVTPFEITVATAAAACTVSLTTVSTLITELLE